MKSNRLFALVLAYYNAVGNVGAKRESETKITLYCRITLI